MRIFDGHNDVLSRLAGSNGGAAVAGFLSGDGEGHLDLPRALRSGLAGGCFAVFTCSPSDEDYESGAYYAAAPRERALEEALAQIALLLRLARSGSGIRIVRAAGDLDGDGIAAVLHLEGAEPVGPGLDELDVLHAAGMRSLGLVWSRPNAFATGVPFRFPGSPDQGAGLTDRGRALVRACNELRILVDVSHLNERGFWDVADVSTAPLVASHSGAHVLCASPRNLTDDQLRAIGERRGLVGINFHVGFLRADGAEDANTPLAAIVEHASHVAQVAGIDCVGLGSDFDGAMMPAPLGDVTGLPALLGALRDAGFSEAEVEGIAFRNWRRVLEATWAE